MQNKIINKSNFLRVVSYLTLFMCILTSLHSSAQSLRVDWVKAGGGQFDDWAHVALDSAGNVVFAGAITNNGSISGTPIGVADGHFQEILLGKFDPSGNLLWAHSSGGELMDSATSVAINASDQILITGYFRDTTTDFFSAPGLTSVGERDVFTALFNNDGTLRWVKTGGGPVRDFGYDVDFDSSGQVLVTGQIAQVGNFDGTRINAGFSGSTLVLKQATDSGAVIDLDTYGVSTGLGIAHKPGGGYVVVGEVLSWTDFGDGRPLAPSGLTGGFIASYSATDELIFKRSLDGNRRAGLDNPYDVVVAASGRIYVTGQFAGVMTLDSSHVLTSTAAMRDEYGDGYVVCYEPDGTVCWAMNFGGDHADIGVGLDIGADGNLALVGTVVGEGTFGSRTFHTTSDADGFVARLNSDNGAVLSFLTIGGVGGGDGLESVTSDASGNLYVGGYFDESITLAGTTYSATNRDLLIAKLFLADPVGEDGFENDDTPETAATISTPWIKSRRCPAWLARRVPAGDTCEGIFVNGTYLNSAGVRVGPPRGSEEVWSMRISGRTLTDDADFYRVPLPDPATVNINMEAPPNEPLPECGGVTREDIGPTGRDNTVHINTVGRFTVKLIPLEDVEVTGQGVNPREPVLLYSSTTPRPDLLSSTGDLWRVNCPRELHGLDQALFSIGEGVMRDEFARGAYDLELEYVVEVRRGVPDWAFEHELWFDRGLLPDFAGVIPGSFFDFIGNLPEFRFEPNCLADGPGCWDFYTVQWPGGKNEFRLDIAAASGMIFRLLDEQQIVLGEIGTANVPGFTDVHGFKAQTLNLKSLPEGTYYLAVGGAPGRFALSYQGVEAMPVHTPVSQASNQSVQIGIGLLILSLLFFAALLVRRNVQARRLQR